MSEGLKPLRTQVEIDAAYPVHRDHRDREQQFSGAIKLLDYLRQNKIKLCIEVDPEEFEGQEYALALGWASAATTHGLTNELLFEALGLDYTAYLCEKEDMLDQFRKRQPSG